MKSQTNPGLFPENFRVCGSLPTHWADWNPTFCFAHAVALLSVELLLGCTEGKEWSVFALSGSHTGVPREAQAWQGLCPSPVLGTFLLLLGMVEEVTPKHNFPNYAKISKPAKQTGGEFRPGVCCLPSPSCSTGDI